MTFCKGCMSHGPGQPCTCLGYWACSGNVIGYTCDINWDGCNGDGSGCEQ